MKKLILICSLLASQLSTAGALDNSELERKTQLTGAAFSCAVFNGWVGNESERKRLFEIGLTNGRDIAKVFKSEKSAKIMNYESFNEEFLLGFIVETINATTSDEARQKIFYGAEDSEDMQKTNAYIAISNQNCNIIK